MNNHPEGIRRHDYELDEQTKKAKNRQQVFVDRAIERGYDALSMGDWGGLAEICDGLFQSVGLDETSLEFYTNHNRTTEMPWSYEAARAWLLADTTGRTPAGVAEAAMRRSSYSSEVDYLRDLFVSLETACVIDHHVDGDLQDTQPVYGFASQLGERYVRPESSATGAIDLRDLEDELVSVLCAGGKGSGKSTAVEALALDSYAAGHKVVDVVDFLKAENVTYDIPQQDNGEGLLKARESMGLRTGYDDVEMGLAWLEGDEPGDELIHSPEMEILVPMTPGLGDTEVPTIPNVGEATVKPFTVPASDLSYRQLVMLLHHTTTARESAIRSAHQHLRDTGMDWTLADLASAVREKSTAQESMQDDIETSLRTAQAKGFIRDNDCPHSLEWGEIMRDNNTITAFSVHTVQEQSDRLMVLSYLLDSMYEARRQLLLNDLLHTYPPMTAVMREMHEVAPRSKSEQDSESTIESYMIDTLERLFALTRHANMEILGDTQKFHRQLSPDVSGLFDHILAFEGYVPDVKRIFKTRVDDTRPVEKVAQFSEPGKCAFISEDGYKMPIQMAPGRSHHLEARHDGRGLGFRTRVDAVPDRMLPAPWDCEVPERLRFGGAPSTAYEMFFEKYIQQTGNMNDYAVKENITEAYHKWAEANGHEKIENKKLHRLLKRHFDLGDDTDSRPTIDGERKRVHKTLVLNFHGGGVRQGSAASP